MRIAKTLESAVLSDTHRTAKLAIGWILLLWMMVYCSLLSLGNYVPGMVEFLEKPAEYDNSELSLAFATLLKLEDSLTLDDQPRYLLRSSLGFFPLRGPLIESAKDLPSGEMVSLKARWHRDGTLTVTELWLHPLRPWKERVSTYTSLGLLLALTVRYRLDRPLMVLLKRLRRPSPPPSPAPASSSPEKP